jgi:hypothetical protein
LSRPKSGIGRRRPSDAFCRPTQGLEGQRSRVVTALYRLFSASTAFLEGDGVNRRWGRIGARPSEQLPGPVRFISLHFALTRLAGPPSPLGCIAESARRRGEYSRKDTVRRGRPFAFPRLPAGRGSRSDAPRFTMRTGPVPRYALLRYFTPFYASLRRGEKISDGGSQNSRSGTAHLPNGRQNAMLGRSRGFSRQNSRLI